MLWVLLKGPAKTFPQFLSWMLNLYLKSALGSGTSLMAEIRKISLHLNSFAGSYFDLTSGLKWLGPWFNLAAFHLILWACTLVPLPLKSQSYCILISKIRNSQTRDPALRGVPSQLPTNFALWNISLKENSWYGHSNSIILQTIYSATFLLKKGFIYTD